MAIRVQTELSVAIFRYKRSFWMVVALSAVMNILQLSGSIYLMAVYDSVLPSQSLPTLFGLFAMVVVAYVFQGLFDLMRGRILANVGAGLGSSVAMRVQSAASGNVLQGMRSPGDGLTAMRDLDNIRNFLSSSGPAALIDLPWIIFFIVVLSLLHIWLGVAALIGATILIAITFVTDSSTRAPTSWSFNLVAHRNEIAESNLRHVEMLAAMGMRDRMDRRWYEVNRAFVAAQEELARRVATFGSLSRIFRLFLQSGVLTVGALLVIDREASAGVIFASAVLSARALAPVDQTIANWRGFAAARSGWTRLNELLDQVPYTEGATVTLPLPSRQLSVEHIFVAPPGSRTLTLSDVSFRLEAGDALGVVGRSAAGKTSLARAIVGAWEVARGAIRLDKATLDQWDRERFGDFIGYLPQGVELLHGTIAENIARFDPSATADAIIDAAKKADVHDMIITMPDGYDTNVGVGGAILSAGQRQRIGLARALYGDPFLVVLDEPSSNLDLQGEKALGAAIAGIRKRGGIAIVIAHRPATVAEVNYLLHLTEGKVEAFGPRDKLLTKIVTKPTSTANSGKPVAASEGKA